MGPETKQSLENIMGPLMGGPKCRVSNLGKMIMLHVTDYLCPMLPV